MLYWKKAILILLLSLVCNCTGELVKSDQSVSLDTIEEIKHEITELRQQNEAMANEIATLKNGQHLMAELIGKFMIDGGWQVNFGSLDNTSTRQLPIGAGYCHLGWTY